MNRRPTIVIVLGPTLSVFVLGPTALGCQLVNKSAPKHCETLGKAGSCFACVACSIINRFANESVEVIEKKTLEFGLASLSPKQFNETQLKSGQLKWFLRW